MAPDDQLDLLSSLLTSLRNAKATFGEDSAKYREMKAWIDDHISSSAASTAQEPADAASNQAAPEQERLPQQQHVFNLAFRPRPQGAGYAQ
ncbi:hypothetical protein SLS58_003047 [Diplodia intermedia]|uniref:Uncharacterized protein n=1 Tax=Diplodia intermedia TaxID=856260 RepID=A0ABR3TXJ3_9PEZI